MPRRARGPGSRKRPVRRTGGRSARVQHDVLAAAVELLAESGWAGFAIEKVAARAGVNKTTVYRRWPTLSALLADAVSPVLESAIPVPDTGSLGGDLRQLLAEASAFLGTPLGEALVRASVGAPRTPELVAAQRSVWAKRFGLLADIVRRAIARGELPARTDHRFLLELLSAPLYFRIFITAETVDARYLDRVADFVADALAGASGAAGLRARVRPL